MSVEAQVEVPGAVLQYRRAGTGKGPVLVFENGWSASHHNWAWIERKLAPHAQLLFYDRAGIGRSRTTAPQTVEGISGQFAAMLKALNIGEPVIVIGHSYGGLVGALHLAQQPQALRALIQLDASPWQDDEVLDAQFRLIRYIAPVLKFFALIDRPDPLFAPACKTLPEPEASLLVQHAMGSRVSLRGAEAELALLGAIRRAIAAQPSDLRRLILSADRSTELKSALARKLLSGKRTRQIIERMQSQHRAYAARGTGGAWEALPLDHGAFVFTQAGADVTAARILGFLNAV